MPPTHTPRRGSYQVEPRGTATPTCQEHLDISLSRGSSSRNNRRRASDYSPLGCPPPRAGLPLNGHTPRRELDSTTCLTEGDSGAGTHPCSRQSPGRPLPFPCAPPPAAAVSSGSKPDEDVPGQARERLLHLAGACVTAVAAPVPSLTPDIHTANPGLREDSIPHQPTVPAPPQGGAASCRPTGVPRKASAREPCPLS